MSAFTTQIEVRFGHVDPAGIAFYPRIYEYVHEVFEELWNVHVGERYYQLILEEKVGFPLVHSEVAFRHPLRFGDRPVARVTCFHLGRSSLGLRYRFQLDDTLCLDARMTTACIDLVDGQWRDASTLAASGAFILHGPAYGSAPGGAVVKLAGSQPIRVSTIEPRSVPFEVSADAAETTIRIPRTGREDAVTVTLDAPPASATATADEGTPVTMCPGPLRTPLLLDRRADASAQIHMNELHPFVSGWHPVEADPDFFRWTASENAIVRIPIAPPGPVRLTITATPAAPAAQKPAIAVRVNGCRLESTPMRQGQGDYEWVTGSECWQPGMNLLTISVTPLISPASLVATHDTRLLGARIGSIRLARMSTGLAF